MIDSSPREGFGRGRSPAVVALVLALLFGGVSAGVWQGVRSLREGRAARAAFPLVAGELRVEGLLGSVSIHRDGRGVPHVEASSEADAWLAVGIVHAQDRLNQMLWLRRLARGETAALVGEAGLRADRLARTLGIARHAKAQAERLDPQTRTALRAYARGVNAHLERIRAGRVAPPVALARALEAAGRPPELASGGVSTAGEVPAPAVLEDWTVADSIAVVKLVAWGSGAALETGPVLSELIERLGGVAARPFFPTGLGVRGVNVPIALTDSEPSAETPGASPPRERPELDLGVADLRAHAWVLSGGATDSGAPMLGVDFHLSPTAPALVYEVQVSGGGLDVAGVTIPGVPVVWAGRNPHVAWAATPARVAIADLYRERLREGEPQTYKSGSGWRPLEERDETIVVHVPGRPHREEVLTVRETRHGPLIGHLLSKEREPLSLAWTGAEPGDGIASFLAIARAGSSEDLLAALEAHHEPVVAVAYADRQGAIGMQVAGWIPRRVLPVGLVAVPGQAGVFDWREPISWQELPTRHIDARAARAGTRWVVAADNALGEATDIARIDWLWRTGDRERRIEVLLRGLARAGPVDLRTAADEHADLVGAVRPEAVSAVLELAGERQEQSSEVREVVDILEGWDGEMRPGSRGAAAYHILLDHLVRALFAGPVGHELLERYLALPKVRPGAIVERILETAAHEPRPMGWSQRGRVAAAVQASLRRTWVSLAFRLGPNRQRWDWGHLHPLSFRSFTGLGGGGRFAPELGPVPVGGVSAVLGLADYDPGDPFAARTVPAYRMVVDMASPDRMLSTLAPGQSEHPGHPHFADGLTPWLRGSSTLLVSSRFLVEEESVGELRLEPVL